MKKYRGDTASNAHVLVRLRSPPSSGFLPGIPHTRNHATENRTTLPGAQEGARVGGATSNKHNPHMVFARGGRLGAPLRAAFGQGARRCPGATKPSCAHWSGTWPAIRNGVATRGAGATPCGGIVCSWRAARPAQTATKTDVAGTGESMHTPKVWAGVRGGRDGSYLTTHSNASNL